MKLIFFVATFFYFFPMNANAAWYYIPDNMTLSPSDGVRFSDVNGSYTTSFLSQPVGGFYVDPLNPLTPVSLSDLNAVIPTLPQSIIDAAFIQANAEPFPAIDWLQSSVVTAFFLFLWSLAYSAGLVTATVRKGA